MCGRYSLALRPGQVRQMLQNDDMFVDEAPDDGDEDAPGAPRQSYNFAPGYHGIVYRADVPDWGAGPRKERTNKTAAADEGMEVVHAGESGEGRGNVGSRPKYKLQSMKWGLIPFFTKRNPGYSSLMKTINCRDDSLAQNGGMWSTMKARKRCVIVAQGFYEWLNKGGGRDKIPHFVKRKDEKLMCFAGLWDVVQYEGEEQEHYTYTIITTSSNEQLNFLHDRMPVIFDNGSESLRTWLDPKRHEWSNELQSLLKPYEGHLEVYPVSREVGKVGNNSPNFIIPVDSKDNKNNIANFFASAATKKSPKKAPKKDDIASVKQPGIKVKDKEGFTVYDSEDVESQKTKHEELASGAKSKADHGHEDDRKPDFKSEEKEDFRHSPSKDFKFEDEKEHEKSTGAKRDAGSDLDDKEPRKKAPHTSTNNMKNKGVKESSPQKGSRPKISATSNGTKSPVKGGGVGNQKITKFFANSS
ncbi:DUF159-domain-containing protein [Xylariaceae sp. FL0016]|nr:DUF159-domain-containing protein [Xylariaceae sp. FL0016]